MSFQDTGSAFRRGGHACPPCSRQTPNVGRCPPPMDSASQSRPEFCRNARPPSPPEAPLRLAPGGEGLAQQHRVLAGGPASLGQALAQGARPDAQAPRGGSQACAGTQLAGGRVRGPAAGMRCLGLSAERAAYMFCPRERQRREKTVPVWGGGCGDCFTGYRDRKSVV